MNVIAAVREEVKDVSWTLAGKDCFVLLKD